MGPTRSRLRHCLVLLTFALVIAATKADDFAEDAETEFEDAPEPVDAKNEQYVAPKFVTPTVDKSRVNFVDWFEDKSGIGRKWYKSIAKKEGTDESIAKYNGEWEIGSPAKVAIEGDYGLVVKTKARHHAIAAKLNKPFHFGDEPLVVQYEVKYEEGQECGGGYLKLLSEGSEKDIQKFHDKTPYTIMFGPDKCGMTSKVHFILRHTNPKNGTISEHHAKQPSKSLASYFDDKKTHLYTLVIRPDEHFQVLVDNYEIMSGSLLKDLEPAIEPPKEIPDPDDKKPQDWDERELIEDPEAKKPEDWDESQPREVLDEDATKPDDWLEDEEQLIPDPEATKPEDWDDSMDGEWEPKKIPNPKCEGRSGCGKWKRPMKENPLYKGKWSPPKISNPAYKGKWSPRLIENPHYFEAQPFKQLTTITAIGFELWTMSSGIVFDNIIIATDENVARDFARQTFNIKVDHEKLLEKVSNPSTGIVDSVLAATEEKPWLWAVLIVAVLLPIIGISIYCFGRKSTKDTSGRAKKTDDAEPDDEVEEEEELANGKSEEASAGPEVPEVSQKPATSKDDLEEDSGGDESTEEAEEANKESEKPKASPSQARRRARRQD
ncbi:CNX-1 protein [Aphelenchoides avenae]|nr:CNX-1 protein [Aphelenchus avenae]